MATVTKSLRIDERMLKIINDYNNIIKLMFNSAPTQTDVLTNCIVKGFEDNLSILRFISISTPLDETASKVLNNVDFKEKCSELIKAYDNYVAEFNYNAEHSERGQK